MEEKQTENKLLDFINGNYGKLTEMFDSDELSIVGIGQTIVDDRFLVATETLYVWVEIKNDTLSIVGSFPYISLIDTESVI